MSWYDIEKNYEDLSLKGLKAVLRKHNETGEMARNLHWKIAKGGYDLCWQLCYDNVPIIDALQEIGYVELTNNRNIPERQWLKITDIIIKEYPECRREESRAKDIDIDLDER